MSKNSDTKRLYSLDFIKALAVCCIVIYHYIQVTGIDSLPLLNIISESFNFSYLVEFFFLLSGFVMYRTASKIYSGEVTAGSFLTKRWIRFLPLLILSSLAYTALSYVFLTLGPNTEWYFDSQINLIGTITSMLGIQFWGILPGSSINFPLWYISVLLFCYCVLCFILFYFSNKKASPIYGYIIVIFLGITAWNREFDFPCLNQFIGRGLYSFFFGMVFAYIYHNNLANKNQAMSALISLALFSVSVYLVVFHNPWLAGMENYFCTFIAYPALLLFLINKYIQRFLQSPLFGLIGKISYHVYGWHLVVYYFLFTIKRAKIFDINFQSGRILLLSFLLSWAVGCFSFFILELLPQKRRNVENQHFSNYKSCR